MPAEFIRTKNTATRIIFPLISTTNRPAYYTATTWVGLTNENITAYSWRDNQAGASLTISGTPVQLGSTGLWELALTAGEMNPDSGGDDYVVVKLNADEIDEQTVYVRLKPLQANMQEINGKKTNDHNAVLKLKQFSILNDSGVAVIIESEGNAAGNGCGVSIIGAGTEGGIKVTGGLTGSGVEIVGGGSGIYCRSTNSGDGIKAEGGPTGGAGIHALGIGGSGGHGLYAEGGSGGGSHGIYGVGGSTSGDGIRGWGQTLGCGLLIQGTGANKYGLNAISNLAAGALFSGGTNNPGLRLTGLGSGAGILSEGGASGHGVDISGGLTSGNGINILTTDGHGVFIQSHGTNQQAIYAEATAATAAGVYFGGGSGGAGLSVQGFGSSPGVTILGGGHGILSQGGTNSSGLVVSGQGAGKDIDAKEIGTPSDLGSGADLSSNAVDIYGAVDTVESTLSTIDGKIDVIDTNVDDIETLLGIVDGKVDVIGAGLAVIDGNVDDIETLLNVVDGKVDIIDTNVDNIGTLLGTVDGKVDVIDMNVDTIVAKLPTGIISDFALTDTIDGITVNTIFEITMAMVNGRFKKDYPIQGNVTFFKRDNISSLFTVDVSTTERIRV